MHLLGILLINNDPWHWSISGLIIGLIVPALLIIGNKSFGVSSSLRHICTIVIPTKKAFFNYDLKPYYWSLIFIGGILLGGIFSHLFGGISSLELGPKTTVMLSDYNLNSPTTLYPTDLFNFQNTKGLALIIFGSFLVGFGTRWANGCTSGHSIMGIANLSLTSLIATIAFFVGGLIMTHFILPYLL